MEKYKYTTIDEMLKENQESYVKNAWKNYTIEELQWWIRLLRKRATHRTSHIKSDKDITDAENYYLMLCEKIKHGGKL